MPPDPCRPSDERRSSIDGAYVTAVVNNPENDDDDISYEGYEILPQDFNEGLAEPKDVDFEDSSSEDEDPGPDSTTPSHFDQSVKIELRQLWNSPIYNRVTDIAMDSSKEEEIKTAMASFKLPSTSIPSWAKNIPEEQWKQQIFKRLNPSNSA